MAETLNQNLTSLITDAGNLFRYATLWEITRSDSTVLRFTDHNAPLIYGANTYSPVGGVSASAQEMVDGLGSQNLEMVGIINSDDIKQDDLRAEKYHDAQVVEMLVDWRYPFAGIIFQRTFWVEDTVFTHETWSAQLVGLSARLLRSVGNVFTRNCRFDLGDSRCGITLATWTDSFAVSAVTGSAPRRKFTDSTAGEATQYYQFGVVTFTSGANNGLSRPVKSFSSGLFQMIWDFPYDVEIGDTFDVYPGCGKITGYCQGTAGDEDRPWANNIASFGGFQFMPGNLNMIKTPNAK